VLGHLIGHSGVVATVAFLTFLGLACWVYGKISLTWSSAARLLTTVGVVAIALSGGWFAYGFMYTAPEETGEVAVDEGGLPKVPDGDSWNGRTPWLRQRPGLHRKLAAAGHTVFVRRCASWVWCPSKLTSRASSPG
ncbi:MAG: hypothetical protein ACYSVY_09355, partial [Planctomycetota bacterium]|jgi:hypothetical protein